MSFIKKLKVVQVLQNIFIALLIFKLFVNTCAYRLILCMPQILVFLDFGVLLLTNNI